jgi:hypothetical protein
LIVPVLLERVFDGLQRTVQYEDYDYGIESTVFMWQEGNYSCDCNRALFFARASGDPDPEPRPCGDIAFRVLSPDWLRD